jgi:hypothetical protein
MNAPVDLASVHALDNFDLAGGAPEARADAVRFAFEFPRLLEEFQRADAIANRAKRRNRSLGYASIALVLAALLTASSSPLVHQAHVSETVSLAVGYAAAGLGLAGALLVWLGMLAAAPRQVWLAHRLRTEMMRLFHFHFLAARLPDLASARGDASRKAAYLADRDVAFASLLGKIADPKRELARIAAREGESDFRSVPEAPLSGAEDPSAVAQAFMAWRALRLEWQLGYADAMLGAGSTKAGWSPRQMDDAFATTGWFAVALIVALHIAMIGGGLLQTWGIWLESAIVWTALIALAVRALEDGLQPQRDVERYEQYRANIIVARERFDAADTTLAKLEVMRAFERNSLEEMRVFLRTHARSRFKL